MKKILLLLVAFVAILGFTGCDVIGSSSDDGDEKTLQSTWYLKGSFDSWVEVAASDTTEEQRHFLTMDELDNNIQTFVMDTPYTIDYEFVLKDTVADKEWKAPSSDLLVPGTPVTFLIDGTDDITNAKFRAVKSTYTVQVDLTDPTAPSVSIIPGSVDAVPPTASILAEKLQILGSAFSIGWTATAGVLDETAKTVTYDDLVIASKNGEFGFNSLDGFLKGVSVESPTTEGSSSTAANLLTDGDNCKLTTPPFSDSVYTVVVTLDPTASEISEKYSMVVTLKTLGSASWAFDPWDAVYIAGTVSDWAPADFGVATLENDIATFAFTADAESEQFKVGPNNDDDWGDVLGFGGIIVDEASITLSDDGGNISFDSVVDTSYTITVDFTTDTYKQDGKPTVKVLSN